MISCGFGGHADDLFVCTVLLEMLAEIDTEDFEVCIEIMNTQNRGNVSANRPERSFFLWCGLTHLRRKFTLALEFVWVPVFIIDTKALRKEIRFW